MMTNYFPMGAFDDYDPKAQAERDPDMTAYCYLFHILLVIPVYKGKSGIPYISKSKCEHCIEGPRYLEDNGRVRSTEACDMWITEVDWKIIKETYNIFYYEIKEMYAAKKGYLPAEFKCVVMDYYRKKTLLKGSPEGSDDAYMYDRSKNMLNSTYGMSVTRIDNGTVEYHPENLEDPYKLLDPAADYLDKYYKSRNSFLPYQWGIWVTAHARYKLHEMLEIVGHDVIYCDTDSIKFVGDHLQDFEDMNKRLQQRAETFGAYADDKHGKRYYLGTWSQEETMDRFVTLGAKKYLADYGGHIKSTIAGVNKKAGADFFNKAGMEAFKIGTVIENSGHLVAYRNNEPIHKIVVNHDEMTTASNMALVDDTYTLGVTDSYLNLLEAVVNNIFTWEVE